MSALEFIWHQGSDCKDLQPISQVYGVCFDTDGRVLLLRQKGQDWNIPGGTPEAGETPIETLVREVYEETTIQIGNADMIGYQECFEDGDFRSYQLRYAALVERIDPQLPDPDKGETHERLFVDINNVMDYITYPQYREMFEAAKKWYSQYKKTSHEAM